MKRFVIKVTALLLTLWYSMSIIGFDVHTCSGSGRSFVATFLEGLTCEDIHPEHSCDPAACCADSHEEHSCCCGHDHDTDGFSFEAKSCCSNDYQVLSLTGTLSSDDHRYHDDSSCGYNPYIGLHSDIAMIPTPASALIAYVHRPDSGFFAACDMQAALNIWRL